MFSNKKTLEVRVSHLEEKELARQKREDEQRLIEDTQRLIDAGWHEKYVDAPLFVGDFWWFPPPKYGKILKKNYYAKSEALLLLDYLK